MTTPGALFTRMTPNPESGTSAIRRHRLPGRTLQAGARRTIRRSGKNGIRTLRGRSLLGPSFQNVDLPPCHRTSLSPAAAPGIKRSAPILRRRVSNAEKTLFRNSVAAHLPQCPGRYPGNTGPGRKSQGRIHQCQQLRSLETEWHVRLQRWFSCIILTFIAIPSAITFQRRSTMSGIGIALFLAAAMLFLYDSSPPWHPPGTCLPGWAPGCPTSFTPSLPSDCSRPGWRTEASWKC